mmetsp:Transcript_59457/g.133560  ORF Transcript_59457/g.133560 Transcript_59457/m.133560 type:complete len:214 (-) Transcript_59457:76-717(-)
MANLQDELRPLTSSGVLRSSSLQTVGKAAATPSSGPAVPRTPDVTRPRTSAGYHNAEVDKLNFWPDASSEFWPEGSGLRRTQANAPLLVSQVRQVPIQHVVRKVQNRRNPFGGFMMDPKPREVSAGNTPVREGIMHGTLSHSVSASVMPLHLDYPRISEMKEVLVDHAGSADRPIKAFCNPRDHFVRYREDFLKFGNQQIMRGNIRISRRPED